MEKQYQEFWSNLDPEIQEVIRKMDAHEGLGFDRDHEIADRMVTVLHASFDEVGRIAESMSQNKDDYDRHIETLLLILSYSPNPHSYWFVTDLIENHGDVYDHISQKAYGQKPLKMYGKLLRERILFYITRKNIMQVNFSRQSRKSVIAALEELRID